MSGVLSDVIKDYFIPITDTVVGSNMTLNLHSNLLINDDRFVSFIFLQYTDSLIILNKNKSPVRLVCSYKSFACYAATARGPKEQRLWAESEPWSRSQSCRFCSTRVLLQHIFIHKYSGASPSCQVHAHPGSAAGRLLKAPKLVRFNTTIWIVRRPKNEEFGHCSGICPFRVWTAVIHRSIQIDEQQGGGGTRPFC